MSIEAFSRKHGKPRKSIEQVVRNWKIEFETRRLLELPITSGLVLGDYLQGQSTLELPHDLVQAMESAFPRKVTSYDEAQGMVRDILSRDESSMQGLLNTLQGKIGEFRFKELTGGAAELSQSANQAGWDLVKQTADGPEYIQVKVYGNAEAVIEHIRAVEEKVEAGSISGVAGETVREIDFAVSSEIYDEVKRRVAEEGLNTKILDLQTTREDLREWAQSQVETLANPLENFVGELLSGSATAAVLHAAANALWVGLEKKSLHQALDDTIYGTVVSSGTMASVMAFEGLAAEILGLTLAGPFGGVAILGVGVGSRAFVRRIADRRYFVERLDEDSERLSHIVQRLKVAS